MERFVFDDTEILTTQIESFIDLPQIASWEIKLHDYLDVLVLTELSSDLLITAGTAHNYIFVGPGNDHIDTGLGDDRIFAGDGNDTLIGGFGSDVLNGAGGDDVLNAGNGEDWVDAGDGDDLIIGGSGLGDDYYSGGDGVDTIKYSSATAGIRVNLSDGAASSKKLGEDAGIGKDTLESIENVIAGNFDDELVDDSSDNRFEGLSGNDRFELSLGKNYTDGGEGNDTIIIDGNGTFGSDLFAHNISSNLQTGTNEFLNLNGKTRFEDVLYGGADVDTVELTDASDAFFLHDTFSGFHSSLTLSNDHEARSGIARIKNIETINAGEGDDIVDLTSPDYSLAGQKITIDGGEGNDTLWGSDANETLKGGNGADELFGGSGVDELIGGSGADEFQFTKTSKNDTIADFNLSDGDTMKFFNTGGAEFDRESISLNSAGDELSIAFGSGVDDALTISLMHAGLNLDDLTADVLVIV
jgi:Ca2+-binding RTX toxin-like protein